MLGKLFGKIYSVLIKWESMTIIFALGGDSLLALNLVSRAKKSRNQSNSPNNYFQYPNHCFHLKRLSIRVCLNKKQKQGLVTGAQFPLTPAMHSLFCTKRKSPNHHHLEFYPKLVNLSAFARFVTAEKGAP